MGKIKEEDKKKILKILKNNCKDNPLVSGCYVKE
jgi:hypothetical protein